MSVMFVLVLGLIAVVTVITLWPDHRLDDCTKSDHSKCCDKDDE